MVQFHIYDLNKHPEGIHFEETLDLKTELLERNAEILDPISVTVSGHVHF